MPFNIQGPELILILVIALLIIGPGKLPDVGSALGKSIREFRKAATDVKDATSIEPTAPANATSAPAANTVAASAAANTLSAPTAAPAPAAAPGPAPAPSAAAPAPSGQAEPTPAETPSEPGT